MCWNDFDTFLENKGFIDVLFVENIATWRLPNEIYLNYASQ